MSMNAVGIDVSKQKSTVAILHPGGEVVTSPFDVPHLSGCFQPLIQHIRALNGQTRIVMECTGRYYEPVARQLSQAGFFVCAVNPQIIHGFQGQIDQTDQVIFHGSLMFHVKIELAVHSFKLCA